MAQERNQLLDATKGVAIILVVLGHSIQQYAGLDNRTALDIGFERFIISFHMPLFMLISGYLFYFSLQRHSEIDIVKKRIKMFALPILTMAVIKHLRWNVFHFEISSFITGFPTSLFNSLWFFWAMIIITMFVCVVHKYFKSHWAGYVVAIVITLSLPNVYPLRAYVHLLPVFLLGYLAASDKVKNALGGGKPIVVQSVLFVIVLGLYLIMFPYFDFDDMIYFSRYSLASSDDIGRDIVKDLFRFSIGIMGSIGTLLALNVLIRLRMLKGRSLSYLSIIGNMTFGLFVFQDLMLMILNPIAKHLNSEYYILNSFISFVVIFITALLLTIMAEKSKLTRFLFLGK